MILGIETSCDETAAALCRDGEIVSSVVSSQWIHQQYGGIVPEHASREHEKWLPFLVKEALTKANVKSEEISGVAVTNGPGLMGSLLMGTSFAQGLAKGLKIPCIGVNHLEAHIYSSFITMQKLVYPFICLLVSGGHTQVWKVNGFQNYEMMGETRDDAAGEALDKGARLLGLGFPGGPEIEKASIGGNPNAFPFPQAFLNTDTIEFSFSGLKTSLSYFIRDKEATFIKENLRDIAASYQEAIIRILLTKLKLSGENSGIKTMFIVGGVAANQRLRQLAKEIFPKERIIYPPLTLCTDNAAMIAYLGEQYLKKNPILFEAFEVFPNLLPTSQW